MADGATLALAEEVRDARIGRRVVVKRMDGAVTDAAVERFLREARLQGKLEHPAIVPVLDIGLEDDGRPYFVMRRVQGTPLADIVRRRAQGDRASEEKHSTRRLLGAFVDVCLAIEYAHTRGVIHRDLRPEHVLIGDFGEVYVTEWGNARLLDGEGAVRRASRSPALPDESLGPDGIRTRPGYAAPELLRRDDDVDGRADVYALGCMLFEILCLVPLHGGDDALEATMMGVDVIAAARAARRVVPPELLDACVAATRPRDERTASARELGDAVQRWLDGLRDLARRHELAGRHRERAVAALEAGDRAAAMREAGSALSLLPDDGAAAALVGRLVLEPPSGDSPEGARIAAESDAEAIRAHARVAAVSYLALPLFLPVLAWLGIKNVGVIVAMGALGLLQAALAFAAARGRLGGSWPWLTTAGNVLIVALSTRVLGPLLGPPAMAATITMATVALPGIRPWGVVPLVFAAAMIVPWLLEQAGVLAPTIEVSGDALRIHSEVVALPHGPAYVVFAIQTVALLVIAVNYGRYATRVSRDARLRLRSQAWHLAQLTRND